jgi:hypothetical protein
MPEVELEDLEVVSEVYVKRSTVFIRTRAHDNSGVKLDMRPSIPEAAKLNSALTRILENDIG